MAHSDVGIPRGLDVIGQLEMPSHEPADETPLSAAVVLKDWTVPKRCGIGEIRELAAMVKRVGDPVSNEGYQLRKILLELITEYCVGQCVQGGVPAASSGSSTGLELLGSIDTVTEQGNDSLLSTQAALAVRATYDMAYQREKDEAWHGIVVASFSLLNNLFSNAFAAQSSASAASAVHVVFHALETGLLTLLSDSLKADAISILSGVRPRLSFTAVPLETSAQYFTLLCWGCTLHQVSLPLQVSGTTPQLTGGADLIAANLKPPATPPPPLTNASFAAAKPASFEPLTLLTFPSNSAAALCRKILAGHLSKDAYHALYHIRALIHSPNTIFPSEASAAAGRAPALHKLGIAALRGAVAALTHFSFPSAHKDSPVYERALSTKETLVVLCGFRHAVATGEPSVVLDVLFYVKTLLSHEVAAHMESQWPTVLVLLKDIAGFALKTPPLRFKLLEPHFTPCLLLLDSLRDRLPTEKDLNEAMSLIDACHACFEGTPAHKAILLRAFKHLIHPSLPGAAVQRTLKKYLLHPCIPPEWVPDFFKVYRTHFSGKSGYLVDGLISWISDPGDKKTFRSPQSVADEFRWTSLAAEEVVSFIVELLDPPNVESVHLEQQAWASLVATALVIARQDPSGTELSREKRLTVCWALTSSAKRRAATAPALCPPLWAALAALLREREAAVQGPALQYFMQVACSADLEISLADAAPGQASGLCVCREPTSSVEVEFPVASVLDCAADMLAMPHCLSRFLKLIRHYLIDCNAVVGNITRNAPILVKIATTLNGIMTEDGLLSGSFDTPSSSTSLLYDVIATAAALIPFASSMGDLLKPVYCGSILNVLNGILRKMLESSALFAPSESMVPVVSDVCSSLNVAVCQFLTLDDLASCPKLVDHAADMIKVLGGVCRKALGIVERLREEMDGKEARAANPGQAPAGGGAPGTAQTLSDQPATVHSASLPPSPAAKEPGTTSSTGSSAGSSFQGTQSGPPGAAAPAPSAAQPSSPAPSEPRKDTTSVPPHTLRPSSQREVNQRQCLVSLLSCVHSVVTCPLVDDSLPSCRVSLDVLRPFIESLATLIAEVLTANIGHRVYFLASLVISEVLQDNKRGMAPGRIKHALLGKLLPGLRAAAAMEEKEKEKEKPMPSPAPAPSASPPMTRQASQPPMMPKFSKRQQSASDDDLLAAISDDGSVAPEVKIAPLHPLSKSGSSSAMNTAFSISRRKPLLEPQAIDLLRTTADLAWRLYYLGSADAYPTWDPLTEAIFQSGTTECWMVNGPHAPCVITATTGLSQHVLITVRSPTSVACWTCVLHNRPTRPPYIERTLEAHEQQTRSQNHQVADADRAAGQPAADESFPPAPFSSDSFQLEHEEEMRGLLRVESLYGAAAAGRDGREEPAAGAAAHLQAGHPGGHPLDGGSSTASDTRGAAAQSADTAELQVSVASDVPDLGKPPAEPGLLQKPDDRLPPQPLRHISSFDEYSIELASSSPMSMGAGATHESPRKGSAVGLTGLARFASITDAKRHSSTLKPELGLSHSASAAELRDVNSPPAIRTPTPVSGLVSTGIGKLESIIPLGSELHAALNTTVQGGFILSMFKMSPPPQRLRWDDQLLRYVSALDKIPCKETHKIGLVYVDYGQYALSGKGAAEWEARELAILSNDGGSVRYHEFMCGLGRFKDLKIPREDARESVRRGIWPHPCYYFGALDTSRQEDGTMCLRHDTAIHQVVYHVATIMSSGNATQDRKRAADKKKRHIGNDHVVVTYCEDTSPNIDPFVLNNELNYINILVQPLASDYSRVSIHYKDCQEHRARRLDELLEEVSFGPGLCRAEGGVAVHDRKLAFFVGTVALHASLAAKSWAYNRQQYSSNWVDRLHRIQQLPARFSVRPDAKTADDNLLDAYHSQK